ncbi:MAG TPA: phosphohistidine phosphatase SixA [Acidimicrobiales bacterium]|nr:phosphohistidine phosphatase SixA [Acidimicrobiales bacterium]
MKTLHLLRHAKSSWDDPVLPDRERPLSRRGEKAARRVASHLARKQTGVDLVLCSSAVRARQTLEIVAPAVGRERAVSVEEGLYTADAAALLRRLRAIDKEVAAVLLIGHNPAMYDLAVYLAGDGEAGAIEAMSEKFPTGALATLRTRATWDLLGQGTCYLESFVVPRELPR